VIVAEVKGHYPPEHPGADANQDGVYNAMYITLTEILVAQA